MTITDSMELYRNACGEAAAYGKTAAGSAESYVLYGSNSPYEDRRAAYLEPYYIRIIEAMFYEIMTGGSSPLLSRLCSSNGIRADLKNVQIDFEDVIVGTRGSYDLKPLLDGLNAAFSGDLSKCSALYFGSYSKDVFHGKKFSRNFNYIVWAAKALKDLDSNVAAVRAGGPAAAEEAKTIAITERQPAQEAEGQPVPEPVPAEEMKSAAAAEAQTAAKAEGQPAQKAERQPAVAVEKQSVPAAEAEKQSIPAAEAGKEDERPGEAAEKSSREVPKEVPEEDGKEKASGEGLAGRVPDAAPGAAPGEEACGPETEKTETGKTETEKTETEKTETEKTEGEKTEEEKTEEEKTDLRAGGGADAGREFPEGTAKRAQGNAVVGETQVPAFPVSDLREKLRGFASERLAADENILDGILDLQRKMQDGLKQIREIREGVEYSFVQEAVQQLIALYCQVDDILQYHPDSGNPGGYEDLIESCGIFGENILQSIAMLGASQICDVNVRYDPQLHRTPPGVRPSRGSRITKVARPGFVYKDKVLEKARVEIDLPAQQPD